MDPKKFSNDGFILMSSLFTEPFFSCLRAEKWKEQFYIAEWNFFTPSTLITLLLSELDKKKQKNILWANEEQPTFIFPSTNKSFNIQHKVIIEKSALKFKEWQNHRNWLFFLFLPWCDGGPQNAESFCQMASIELCDQLINLINGELSLQRLIVLPNKSFVF